MRAWEKICTLHSCCIWAVIDVCVVWGSHSFQCWPRGLGKSQARARFGRCPQPFGRFTLSAESETLFIETHGRPGSFNPPPPPPGRTPRPHHDISAAYPPAEHSASNAKRMDPPSGPSLDPTIPSQAYRTSKKPTPDRKTAEQAAKTARASGVAGMASMSPARCRHGATTAEMRRCRKTACPLIPALGPNESDSPGRGSLSLQTGLPSIFPPRDER